MTNVSLVIAMLFRDPAETHTLAACDRCTYCTAVASLYHEPIKLGRLING